jgi:hypothetical protein
VDPNAGDPKDAILVYCRMEDKSTCVQPKPNKTPIMNPVIKTPGEYWLSDLDGGSQVSIFSLAAKKLFLFVLIYW